MDQPRSAPTQTSRDDSKLSRAAQFASPSSTLSELSVIYSSGTLVYKMPSTPLPGQIRTRTEAEKDVTSLHASLRAKCPIAQVQKSKMLVQEATCENWAPRARFIHTSIAQFPAPHLVCQESCHSAGLSLEKLQILSQTFSNNNNKATLLPIS